MNERDNQTIRSARLDLVLLSPEVISLSINGDTEAVERMLQLSVPPEWYEEQSLLRFRLKQVTEDPEYLPWSLRAMALRERHLMVGYLNFHTKPGDAYLLPFSTHGVEFGYEVFPAFRRQGYAREACLALMKWAHEDQHVAEFVVSIAPDNIPSRRLAEGLGFVQVGSHMDEVDGPEDVFRLRYPPPGAA
jgi:[ribosomal protein S5]-alanine N-acetyltransferase